MHNKRYSENTGKAFLAKAEIACQSAGKAGLSAILKHPLPKSTTKDTKELEKYFAQQIDLWLKREIGSFSPEVTQADFCFNIWLKPDKRKKMNLLQLRFVPEYSRWLLLTRGRYSKSLPIMEEGPNFTVPKSMWWPYLPKKHCLSLVDWLGQIRRIVTFYAKGKQE